MNATIWTPDELARISRTTELQLASRRPDGNIRPWATIWVVTAGDCVYVRSAHGWNNGWFQHALKSGDGRIRASDLERDVTFEQPGEDVAIAVTAAYHAKYDRYGPAIVGTVVSPEAIRSTLRVLPDKGFGTTSPPRISRGSQRPIPARRRHGPPGIAKFRLPERASGCRKDSSPPLGFASPFVGRSSFVRAPSESRRHSRRPAGPWPRPTSSPASQPRSASWPAPRGSD